MRRALGILVASAVASASVAIGAAGAAPAARHRATPGVTATTIRVGGLASPPNVLNVPYQDGYEGAKAYFEIVNKKGGVFGKKLELVAQLSDQGSPGGNIRAVRSLVEEKHVFAVLPVMTNSFAGAKYLADHEIPTFGIDVDPGWCGTISEVEAMQDRILSGDLSPQCPRQSLFGEKGSFLCFRCPNPGPSFILLRKHVTRAAIFTYTHPSSTLCAAGLEASFRMYGIDVVFEDKTLNFGFSDASADAQGVRENGAEAIATCMDFGGAFRLAQQLKNAGAKDLIVLAPEGYRPSTVEKYGKALNGWFFGVFFTPWEVKDPPKGTRAYLQAMKKRGVSPSEQSQAGWINAQLLVEGIKKAGKSFTRRSVIDAINSIDDFTADGILANVNWTSTGSGHGLESGPTRAACAAYVEAVNGRFVPRFGKPGRPFVCFPYGPLPATLDDPIYRP
ncbi:MAG TPA: ABC transporter substrate-binding protein [Acidimicrobiia bacterium]